MFEKNEFQDLVLYVYQVDLVFSFGGYSLAAPNKITGTLATENIARNKYHAHKKVAQNFVQLSQRFPCATFCFLPLRDF